MSGTIWQFLGIGVASAAVFTAFWKLRWYATHAWERDVHGARFSWLAYLHSWAVALDLATAAYILWVVFT